MKICVLAIAPYPGLKDLLLEMAKEENSIHMDVEVADLQEAIPLVEQAERKGYHIIVSRGGTADLIRQHVSLPVVDIPVSGYDILRVLTLVKNSNSKVGIIGFPNVCNGVAQVSSLLDFKIPTYAIGHESEVGDVINRAFRSDIQIVLGDVITVRIAKAMGYRGILVTSGKESVADMFAEVRRVFEVYKQGQELIRFYKEILDADPRGTIVINDAKKVLYANQTACRILGQLHGVEGNNIILFSPNLSNLIKQAEEEANAKRRHYAQLNEQQFIVSIVKHEKGGQAGYSIWLDSMENQRNEQRYAAYIPPKLGTFAQVIGSSLLLQRAVSKARKFAQSDRNIWMFGERGTEKCLFAQAIHSVSKRRDQGFYRIACEEVTEEQTDMLLIGDSQEPGLLHGGFAGTVYLENIDRMSKAVQVKWLQAVRNTKIRFIASSSTPITKIKDRAGYNNDLIFALGEMHMNIPPLRERPEDIEEIVSEMIGEYNFESGKQIVGMREEVLDRLHLYGWPGNLLELENLIQEMLILTKGHYTEWNEVNEVLARLEQHPGNVSPNAAYAQIDISGTFEEIEARILRHILQEEGMNQSKTSKRLGINRTTLWRKLN